MKSHVIHVLTVAFSAFALSALCCAPSLEALAQRQELGRPRERALAVAMPIARASKALGLYQLHTLAVHAVHDDPAPPVEVVVQNHRIAANLLRDHRPIATDAAVLAQDGGQAPTIPSTLSVAVLGDSMANTFGYQLARLGRRTGRLQVYFDSQASSGLSQPEIINWPERVRRTLQQRHPSVLVLVFGTNDAVPLAHNGVVYGMGRPEWRAAYRQRVDEMLGVATDRQIPVYWVGMPIMRSESFSEKMRVQNQIYREAIANFSQVHFVDPWPMFTNSVGAFSAYLPDVAGRLELVREQDGIHYTHDGARRLAQLVFDTITAH